MKSFIDSKRGATAEFEAHKAAVPKPFMHIDLDHQKLTRRCAPVMDISSCPGEVTPERLSYKGIDFHMEVEFTDDLDTKFNQDERFWFLLQGFLKGKGINSSLEGFE